MNFAVANHPVVHVVPVVIAVVSPHRRRHWAHKTNFERSFGCCDPSCSFHFLLKVFGAQPAANGGSARIQNPGRESRIPNSDSESFCGTRKFAPLLICCCCCVVAVALVIHSFIRIAVWLGQFAILCRSPAAQCKCQKQCKSLPSFAAVFHSNSFPFRFVSFLHFVA